jgi:hypothetical protein
MEEGVEGGMVLVDKYDKIKQLYNNIPPTQAHTHTHKHQNPNQLTTIPTTKEKTLNNRKPQQTHSHK